MAACCGEEVSIWDIRRPNRPLIAKNVGQATKAVVGTEDGRNVSVLCSGSVAVVSCINSSTDNETINNLGSNGFGHVPSVSGVRTFSNIPIVQVLAGEGSVLSSGRRGTHGSASVQRTGVVQIDTALAPRAAQGPGSGGAVLLSASASALVAGGPSLTRTFHLRGVQGTGIETKGRVLAGVAVGASSTVVSTCDGGLLAIAPSQRRV